MLIVACFFAFYGGCSCCFGLVLCWELADGSPAVVYDGSQEVKEGVMLIDADEANTFLETIQKKPQAFLYIYIYIYLLLKKLHL